MANQFRNKPQPMKVTGLTLLQPVSVNCTTETVLAVEIYDGYNLWQAKGLAIGDDPEPTKVEVKEPEPEPDPPPPPPKVEDAPKPSRKPRRSSKKRGGSK
jgi:hypothetical protein